MAAYEVKPDLMETVSMELVREIRENQIKMRDASQEKSTDNSGADQAS